MSIAIYMLHAIGTLTQDDWADPHYCYSEENFKSLLIKAKQVFSVNDIPPEDNSQTIVLTFDDGHISNYWAGKYIADNGYGSAEFYINPAHIGKDYYMTWSQLQELADLGMSIQSHGLDHSYLSELTDAELEHQLSASKAIIESHIHQPVTRLSPPGGRYDKRCVRLAKTLGYQSILSSQPGIVKRLDAYLLPRIAVLHDSKVETLIAMANASNSDLIRSKIRYFILTLAKTALGTRNYERIRWYLLGVEK